MTNKTLIELKGTSTQMLLEVGELAEILHWGKNIDVSDPQSRLALHRPVPYGRLDDDIAMSLTPELARGLFSSPAIEGHRNGLDWAPVFTISETLHKDGQLTLVSEDASAGLMLTSELHLDKYDVVKVRHTLTNDKAGAYQVNRLANTLMLPERAKELMSFFGRWSMNSKRYASHYCKEASNKRTVVGGPLMSIIQQLLRVPAILMKCLVMCGVSILRGVGTTG